MGVINLRICFSCRTISVTVAPTASWQRQLAWISPPVW